MAENPIIVNLIAFLLMDKFNAVEHFTVKHFTYTTRPTSPMWWNTGMSVTGLILNQYLTSLLTCSHSSPLLLLNQCDFGKVQTQQTLRVCVSVNSCTHSVPVWVIVCLCDSWVAHTLVAASTLAPCLMSSATTSTWPSFEARWRALRPFWRERKERKRNGD